jgi:outer membrane protein
MMSWVFVVAPLLAQVLTLRDAEQSAEAHHPALALSAAAADNAEARAAESRAALLPQVIASGNYKFATGNRTIRIATPLSLGRPPPSPHLYDYLTGGITATQLLTDFGQSTEAWRAARLAAQSSTLDARAARLAARLDVRLAFFAARARRDLVDVAREDVGNQRRHLEQVQGLIDVQMRPAIDLVQARASLGAAELRRISAENDYALARAELGQAMGGAPEGDYDLASDELPPVDGEEAPLDQLTAEARAARLDLAGGQRLVESQEHALSAARASYGPALHLSLATTDAGPAFDPGPFAETNLRWNYSAALVLSWPILEGGRTVARVREQQASLEEARARRALIDLGLRVEIERSRRSVASAKAAIAVSETTLENARERLRLAEGRYQAGVGTALDVSDAQLGYVAAAAQRVQAHYDLASARAQLLHALGSAS